MYLIFHHSDLLINNFQIKVKCKLPNQPIQKMIISSFHIFRKKVFLIIQFFVIFSTFMFKRFKLLCVAGDRFQSLLSSSFVALSFILEKENFSLAKSSSAVGFTIINFSTTLATLLRIAKLPSSADFVEQNLNNR